MNHPTRLIALVALLLLTACGGSDRPVYSGHEQSTAGVPGFTPDGKQKISPYVKLGQSYSVGGKTYVPRYEPDYVEEGMASWYGPGFHGGKTANGETFSTHDHTAAHTTLPMPSIVKVTYLKTGKSTYARVNDRGPFAHNRIIDVSKAVAEDIGMLRDGVGKVRVEYMKGESERFTELLKTGRAPQSIDLASEVIGKGAPETTAYAQMDAQTALPLDESVQMTDTMPPASLPPTATSQPPTNVAAASGTSVWQYISPVGEAQAAQVPAPASSASLANAEVAAPDPTNPMHYPVADMPPAELPPPIANETASVSAKTEAAKESPTPLGPIPIYYVQLGAFSSQGNAMGQVAKVQQQLPANEFQVTVQPANNAGVTMHRVRIGPFKDKLKAQEALERAVVSGVGEPKLMVEWR